MYKNSPRVRRRRVNWTYTYYMHYRSIALFFTITRILGISSKGETDLS